MKEKTKFKISRFFTAPKLGTSAKVFIGLTILLLPLSLLEYLEVGILKYHLKILPKESFYWLFSSIAQSMAAMFGIGGLFAAYIFQHANQKLGAAIVEAKSVFESTLYSVKTDEEFLKELSDCVDHPEKRNWRQPEWEANKKARDKIVSQKTLKSVISMVFKNVTIFMTIVIALSLVALPFSNALTELLFGNIFTLFLLIMVIMSLMRMIRFVVAAVSA